MFKRSFIIIALIGALAAIAIAIPTAGIASRPTDAGPTGKAGQTGKAQQTRTTDVESGAAASTSTYMYYRNGWIQESPRLYLVFWGDWTTANDPYNVQNRLYYFLNDVGGSSWARTMQGYGYNCTVNSYNCGSNATMFKNPTGQFRAWWKDTGNPIPAHPTAAQMAAEAQRAASHFGDYSHNAQYIVVTAHGHMSSDLTALNDCAYHNRTQVGSTYISYTDLPYVPDLGAGKCGNNSVTGSILDGVTIVEGHEYAESVTDPFLNGWYDPSGVQGEIGDKCNGNTGNVQFPSGWTYPVQTLWSNYHMYNSGTGCVFTS